MEKDKIFQLFIILISFLQFIFQTDFGLQNDIIYNYYSSKYLEEASYKNLDEFYEGNLNINRRIAEYNYTIDLKKENTNKFLLIIKANMAA